MVLILLHLLLSEVLTSPRSKHETRWQCRGTQWKRTCCSQRQLSCFAIREGAGPRGVQCPLQTPWVSVPSAILTPETTWSEFFLGLCDGHQAAHSRSYDLGSMSRFHELPTGLSSAPCLLSQTLFPISGSLPWAFGTMSSTNYPNYPWMFPKSILASKGIITFLLESSVPPIFTCLNSKCPIGHWSVWLTMTRQGFLCLDSFLNLLLTLKSTSPVSHPFNPPVPSQLAIWFSATKEGTWRQWTTEWICFNWWHDTITQRRDSVPGISDAPEDSVGWGWTCRLGLFRAFQAPLATSMLPTPIMLRVA